MQKILFIMLAICVTGASYAATAPSTSCPTGYTTIKTPAITLADGSCPTGYTSAGNPTSCLSASPGGVCFMYVPTDMEFSDASGTYHYATICPLTD